MKISWILSVSILLLFILRPAANAQTIVAQDDCEAYNGADYTDENQGTGFSGAFQFKPFGTNDQGGEYIETGSRKITGSKSFGLYANTSGTGKAVSRSFSTALSGLHRISFRVRFDLNTNNGMTAGFVISETSVSSQSMWNTGQRLFLGISGDGLWKYDDGTLKTVTQGGSNFACTGGDIYLIELDFNATSGDSYAFRITNESTSSTSDVLTGTLAGSSGSPIQSIGFGNGVIGSNQNLIFDDIVVTQNPSNPLPVELTVFSADQRQNGVLLQWETATETNNSHFLIERSGNMRQWEVLGSVQGAGNTLNNTRYTFFDASPLPGNNYYRLRQVDFDGKEMLSPIVVVTWTTQGFTEVFPNPFSNAIAIRLSGMPEQSVLTAELLDLRGKVVEKWAINSEQPHDLHVAAGHYLLRISDKNNQTVSIWKIVGK